MTVYQDNRISTGTYKNTNAMQLFVSYDKDFLSMLGMRAGFAYKTVRKRTASVYIYDRDDGNFFYDINAFVGDLDLKLGWSPIYLTLGLNYPFMYSIKDEQSISEEGMIGLQGSLGIVIHETFGIELFYSELKGKMVYRNTDMTKVESMFTTPLVGLSAYFSISL